MSTHTPGPWAAEPNGGDDSDTRRLYICADKGAMTTVAEAYSGVDHGDPEANARLIAAAPDLLAALHEIVRCSDERASFDGDPAMKRWCVATSEVARAAIAKAEGTS